MLPNLRNLIAIGKAKLFQRGKTLQEVDLSIRQGELRNGLEHVQPYGFAHLPHVDADALGVFPAGDKGFGVVITVYDRRYQMRLTDAGDVALYDHEGQCVHLTRTGILIKSAKPITIDTPTANFTGNVTVAGECVVSGIAFTQHSHTGVRSGSDTSGSPLT